MIHCRRGILGVAVMFLLLHAAVSFGQTVAISGHVRDSLTQVPLYPATIRNITSGFVTYADSSGYYYITGHAGDELTYSYLGFYTAKYTVPRGPTELIHNVGMISKREQLQEVTIRSMTTYQKDSMDRAKAFKDYLDQPKPTFIGKDAHSTYDIPNPNYNDAFGISLNPFALFSKKGKNKRAFDKMYPAMERDAFINSRYTPEIVNKLTGLKGDSLSLFLMRFRPTYQFARYAGDLEFWSWIKMKYKAWIKPK